MKKIVFKGTINGKEFNDVKSYNEEMMKVMESGVPVQAESHTESIEETETEEIDMLPGFSDYKQYYLDDLVTGDDDKDNQLFEEWDFKLGEAYNNIRKKIDKMDSNQLAEYIEDLNDVIACIDEDIADAKNDLEKAKLQTKIANNSIHISQLTRSWYENMVNMSNLKYKVEDKCCETGCTCCDEECNHGNRECHCCNEECSCNKQEPTHNDIFQRVCQMLGYEYTPEQAKEHEENYKRLFKEIFG